jgi:hypothetical protein
VNETIKFMESYADLMRKAGQEDEADEVDSQIEQMRPAKPGDASKAGEAKPTETKTDEKPSSAK